MDSNVIKEFLVSIGYKVDGSSERKFQDSVAFATKSVLALGAAVTAATVAISAAVTKIANQFESLYYQSQKIGASVDNIKSVSYAVSQLGGSFQGAQASIGKFAENLRSNPGIENLLKSFGISTRVNGQLRDTAVLLKEFAQNRKLASMPYYQQLQYSNLLGLDEDTFRALRSGKFDQYQREYEAKLKAVGLNNDDAARTFDGLAKAANSLWTTLQVVATKVAAELSPAIQELAKRMEDWLLANVDKIVPWLEMVAKKIIELATAIGEFISKIDISKIEEWRKSLVDVARAVGSGIDKFDAMTKSITGQGGLLTAFELFAIYLSTTWIATILGAFARVGLGWSAMLRVLGIALPGAALGALGADTPAPWNVQPGKSPFKGGYVDQAWQWVKKKVGLTGGDGPIGGNSPLVRRGSAGKPNAHFTKENADAIRSAAKELGTSPEDLATVIGYETAGTFSPSKWGGKGGNYMGLIQFGPPERQAYGASDTQTFPEQMGAVVRYLKARGFKPGMGLLDLYSTINAGRPGRYGVSDGNGTVSSHVQTMQGAMRARALAFLRSGVLDPSGQAGGGPASIGSQHSPSFPAGAGVDPMLGKLPAFMGGNFAPLMPGGSGSDTSVTINQTNTNNITGSGDPADTVSRIGRSQQHWGGDLVRNLQGATR